MRTKPNSIEISISSSGSKHEAILQKIKESNKKNVVKNIMSAFNRFLTDILENETSSRSKEIRAIKI